MENYKIGFVNLSCVIPEWWMMLGEHCFALSVFLKWVQQEPEIATNNSGSQTIIDTSSETKLPGLPGFHVVRVSLFLNK